jgi:undecaprenyl diphosphate synthase
MDGNGRWAAERSLSRASGHSAGLDNIRRIVRFFAGRGVKFLTLFAFSTENWGRPDEEVKTLIELLRKAVQDETMPLHEEGVRINHLGRLDRLPESLGRAIRESVELTKNNDAITLSVAYDYGSRAEIVEAVRAIAADGLSPDEIDERVLARYLYTDGLPDPDLVIRTAGEMRLSNFLLWQAAYAEFYSTDVLWPDFDEAEAARALADYGRRHRRYGRLSLDGAHDSP